MTCYEWQDFILDREYLNDTQREDLDRHLSTCAGCKIWAMALAKVDTQATKQFEAEVSPRAFRERVSQALARQRRQNWMAAVPDLLDALGWSAVGILGMVGLLFWTHQNSWLSNHFVWMGSAALVGSVAWAATVLSKEGSGSGFCL